jgi:hypothetical protein
MCLEGPAAVLLVALASVFPGGLPTPSSPSPDRTLQLQGVVSRPAILQRVDDAGLPLSLDANAALVRDPRLTPAITPQQASAR